MVGEAHELQEKEGNVMNPGALSFGDMFVHGVIVFLLSFKSFWTMSCGRASKSVKYGVYPLCHPRADT